MTKLNIIDEIQAHLLLEPNAIRSQREIAEEITRQRWNSRQ